MKFRKKNIIIVLVLCAILLYMMVCVWVDVSILLSLCVLFLILSLGVNLFFLCSIGVFEWRQNQIDKLNILNPRTAQLCDYKQEIKCGLFELLQSGTKLTPAHREDIKTLFFKYITGYYGKKSAFGYFSNGYCLWALVDTPNLQSGELDLLRVFFDKEILKNPIHKVDQSLFGIVALRLYKYFGFSEYLSYAKQMYIWLADNNTQWGIPYNSAEAKEALIDGIGMCNPFLTSYYQETGELNAYRLALYQLDTFIKYGVDSETGLPAHGFCIEPPYIKMGSANWGRAMSWFALGLQGINEYDLQSDSQTKIGLFKCNIKAILQRRGQISQFVNQGESMHLSATIPIVYYLYSIGMYEPSEEEILLYCKYLHNGVLYHSSGDTKYLNRYNEFLGPYPMAQAVLLMLINIMEQKNNNTSK